MSWRLVEGVPLPDAVAGHPALDFCNTRAGWGAPAPKEYLTAPGVLTLWARENGLLRGQGLRLAVRRPPRPAPLVLDGGLRQPGQGSPVRRATRGRPLRPAVIDG